MPVASPHNVTPSLAILGGTPLGEGVDFPKDLVTCSPEAEQAVLAVLRAGTWSMFTSPEVEAFECEFADFVGARHAVLFNSCTTAIHAALLAHGVRHGDKVAVPAFTYIGTTMPVLVSGATPILVDVDSESQSICAYELEHLLEAKPVRAVIQAHLFGTPGDGERVGALCRKFGVSLIHDCAQFLGNRSATAMLCDSGITCFSFGESKLLQLGEGGAAATNSQTLAERLRLVRHEGEIWLRAEQSRISGWAPTCDDVLNQLASITVGSNYRPLAWIAALGRVKLRELDSQLAARKARARLLLAGLSGLEGLTVPTDGGRTWWTFPLVVAETLQRDAFLAAMLAEKVPAGVHFPRLLGEHPAVHAAMSVTAEDYPNASSFSRQHIVLPIYPAISELHMDILVRATRKVCSAPKEEQASCAARARHFLQNAVVSELVDGLFMFLKQ